MSNSKIHCFSSSGLWFIFPNSIQYQYWINIHRILALSIQQTTQYNIVEIIINFLFAQRVMMCYLYRLVSITTFYVIWSCLLQYLQFHDYSTIWLKNIAPLLLTQSIQPLPIKYWNSKNPTYFFHFLNTNQMDSLLFSAVRELGM